MGDVSQEGNVVFGDLAGGSIDKSVRIYAGKGPTEMQRLIEKFRKERGTDIPFQQTVDRLRHYSTQVSTEQVVGLEAKLEAGHRDDLLEFAKTTKERFAKKLALFQLSESAQEIHAYLLAEVYTRFNNHVAPLIRDGEQPAAVHAAIQASVIDPIQTLLEDNVLQLGTEEINGMVYFLTGNCYVKWT